MSVSGIDGIVQILPIKAVDACVARYATPRGFCDTLSWLVFRVIQAVKSALGCFGVKTEWQQVRDKFANSLQFSISLVSGTQLTDAAKLELSQVTEIFMNGYLECWNARGMSPFKQEDEEIIPFALKAASDSSSHLVRFFEAEPKLLSSVASNLGNLGVPPAVVSTVNALEPHVPTLVSFISRHSALLDDVYQISQAGPLGVPALVGHLKDVVDDPQLDVLFTAVEDVAVMHLKGQEAALLHLVMPHAKEVLRFILRHQDLVRDLSEKAVDMQKLKDPNEVFTTVMPHMDSIANDEFVDTVAEVGSQIVDLHPKLTPEQALTLKTALSQLKPVLSIVAKHQALVEEVVKLAQMGHPGPFQPQDVLLLLPHLQALLQDPEFVGIVEAAAKAAQSNKLLPPNEAAVLNAVQPHVAKIIGFAGRHFNLIRELAVLIPQLMAKQDFNQLAPCTSKYADAISQDPDVLTIVGVARDALKDIAPPISKGLTGVNAKIVHGWFKLPATTIPMRFGLSYLFNQSKPAASAAAVKP